MALANFTRQAKRIALHDGLRARAGAAAPLPPPIAFASPAEAESYLGFLLPDAALLITLRQVLHRSQQSLAVHALPDRQVLSLLAAQLARGELVLTEGQPAEAGAWPLVPPAAVAVPDSISVINLADIPVEVPVPPVLPALEELQIEGAEVLPEIDQTLEQIALTMDSVDLAGVSLAPTPSKVADIGTAMGEASSSVTKSLEDL